MKLNIDHEKLISVLEHFLSLHEADEISYMLTDDDSTVDDVKDKLHQFDIAEK